jgi:carboxypeptidase Taq
MADTLQTQYKKLMERTKELTILQSVESIMDWDMETMMPPKAINLRSQQLSLLSIMDHKMSTDPETGKLLKTIVRHPQRDRLTALQRRNVYLIKKRYDEQTKLPEKLVAETAKQEAIAIDVWKKAKKTKNFQMFRPELEKVLELKKEAAEILQKVKRTKTPYEALIDIYEPKMTTNEINKIFGELKTGLVSLLKKCENAPKQPDVSIVERRIPIEAQRKISKALADFVGYDVTSKMAGGRIDETEHPFTTGYYDDVRITTHFFENDFTSSLFSVLHEAGHALYDQDLPKEWMYQPVGSSTSMGLHESQSRTVENIIGRSREFWTYFLPKLKHIAGKEVSNLKLDPFVHAINQVKPSKIRVEADEVTYCIHIIIRFNLERDLFANKVTVKELPEVWNQSYREYLGVKIENDSEGTMQDTHWAAGSFGYFPSYALGNIYSGQIVQAMETALPNWRTQLAKGNFKTVKRWLVDNIHSEGNLYDAPDLIKKISGKKLSVKPYLNYLNEKYSSLYGF